MRSPQPILLGMTWLVLPAAWVCADILYLSHGGRVEGELLNADESPRRSYVVKTTEGARLVLAPSQIERMVVKSKAERDYEESVVKLPDEVPAHWEAARRCGEAGLAEQRTFHLEEVLRLDPNHTEARHALGYSQVDGKWLRQAEAMEGKGYVRAGGAWRLPQELELEAAAAELQEREVKWRKDLNRWRDWIKGRDPQRRVTAEQSIRGIRDPLAAPTLIDYLTRQREPTALRQLYVDVLAQIGGPAVLATLVRLTVEDRDPLVRERCLDKLATVQSKAAVRQFLKYLKHDENLAVQRAAVALERMQDPEAIPHLIDALITTHKVLEGGSAMSPTFTSDGGAGLSMGGGPKLVKKKFQNEPVRRALLSFQPGANYGFNQILWKDWYQQQHKPELNVSLRRSE